MIVQETRIRTSSGHQAVSRHVLRGARNEAIRVLCGSDWCLADWMKEARREGIRYGLRHIAFNPAEPMSDAALASFAARLCDELQADRERMTLVVHQKDGSTHGHLLLPEWQDDHVLSTRFSWQRLEKCARLEEIRLGHQLVPGRHDRAIVKALRQEGKTAEAEAIEVLLERPVTNNEQLSFPASPDTSSAPSNSEPASRPLPRAAYTSQSRRMAERQGLDLVEAKKAIAFLWAQSDNQLHRFRALLKTKGWVMRAGDRQDTRKDAYIIETADGVLIGSFTRLTKTRMKDFRQFLVDDAARPKRGDIRIAVKPLLERAALERAAMERHAEQSGLLLPPFEELTRDPEAFAKAAAKGGPSQPTEKQPRIVSLDRIDALPPNFAHYIRQWKREARACRTVLNARPPLAYGPRRSVDEQGTALFTQIENTRRQLWQTGKQLQETRRERDVLREKVFVLSRKKRLSHFDEEIERLSKTLAEILRYLLEIVFWHLGLRTTPPEPLCLPVPTEREEANARLRRENRELLQQIVRRDTCKEWLVTLCREADRRRQEKIAAWKARHVAQCDRARRDLDLLKAIWMPPAKLPCATQAEIMKCKLTGDLEKAKYVTRVALRKLDETETEQLAKEMKSEKAAPNIEALAPSLAKVSAALELG
ncbi:hypothetical protein [Asaia bogorensis]|uniref:Uncharacterized protein n=1 Tax=Asaia bogorensis NBRC 16594 TaxID=1231624 RepID=A0AAN4R308_9PROT|nr:hypothetical protein [Asaia bogorensis]BAT20525.1 hypothetical protein Asbog_02270 [Asaia bogorensis NBRC 16594]GBQ79035.1 hypothetical protein AA0311_1922 [Asaia bogorensis NBRC 16594]GEL52051.1 hypothetical protein ABO01nite_00580 [Asaia bogorensis NBRC 16594]